MRGMRGAVEGYVGGRTASAASRRLHFGVPVGGGEASPTLTFLYAPTPARVHSDPHPNLPHIPAPVRAQLCPSQFKAQEGGGYLWCIFANFFLAGLDDSCCTGEHLFGGQKRRDLGGRAADRVG